MFRRICLLVTFLAALWLPFQAVAALSMPFCRHGEAHKAIEMAQAAEHEGCPMHGHQQPKPEHNEHGMTCDQCGYCHLAAAGFMPVAEQVISVVPVGHHYQTDIAVAPESAIPEPPQQPPKRMN